MMESELVQITADRDEVYRRILAFSERKSEQINQQTTERYCARLLESEPEFSCARIDATHFQRSGRSLYPVTSVDNKEGPQTQSHPYIGSSMVTQQSQLRGPDILSRVHEMEIKLEPGSTDKQDETQTTERDVLGRIKLLEERIAFLEGVSPEYFINRPIDGKPVNFYQKIDIPTGKKIAGVNTSQPEITDFELNERIHSLKQRLRQKSQVMDGS